MTNFEKYKEELLSFIRNHGVTPSRIDGAFVSCRDSSCEDCEYHSIDDCYVMFTKWLYKDDGEEHDRCDGCKYEYKRGDESPCTECRRSYEDKFEPKPKKTRQNEFLEHYPDANVFHIKPCKIEDENFINEYCAKYDSCLDCANDYWLQEVEE